MPLVKSFVVQKDPRYRAVCRLLIALVLATSLCLISQSFASAQDWSESFELSYAPVTFDKSEIKGSEVFHVNIAGRLTCTKDLPMSPSEASLTSQVVAEHTVSGAVVTLNSSYTITVKPFPSKKDETAEINQAVPLQFPAQAESGDYSVIGKIVEAKVKVLVSVPVTSYLPQEQKMGTVKYIAPESTVIPENPPPSQPEPGPPPLKSIQTSPDIPAPKEQEPKQIMPWWGELIILVAIAATVFNVVWFLRHRTR